MSHSNSPVCLEVSSSYVVCRRLDVSRRDEERRGEEKRIEKVAEEEDYTYSIGSGWCHPEGADRINYYRLYMLTPGPPGPASGESREGEEP